jgi:hypothetical protein
MKGFSRPLPWDALVQAIRLRDWYLWAKGSSPEWNKPWDGASVMDLSVKLSPDEFKPSERWWKHAFECGCEVETTKIIDRCPSHSESHVMEVICTIKPVKSC